MWVTMCVQNVPFTLKGRKQAKDEQRLRVGLYDLDLNVIVKEWVLDPANAKIPLYCGFHCNICKSKCDGYEELVK